MDIIAEIKYRYNISSLVGYFGLEPNQSGFYKSIYKEDKHPSMKIFPHTNSFYDYSSGNGGDVIKFYEDYKNCDTKTAIKELVQIAGIDRTSSYSIPKDRKNIPMPTEKELFNPEMLPEDEKEFYFERLGISDNEKTAIIELKKFRINKNSEVFTELFNYCQQQKPRVEAINYLTGERFLTPESIERFKLFHIPDYYQVNQHMKKMFEPDRLIQSGLFNHKIQEDGTYKSNLIFYSHRLVIPYLYNGKIIYLRGRYFDENNNPKTEKSKYLGLGNDWLGVNTSKRFYNLDVLKYLLPDERLYITEGEYDSMVLNQEGFNSIAIPAVHNIPAESQFHQLKKFNCIICGDNDTAGEIMVEKLTKIFQKFNIRSAKKTINAKDVTELRKMYEK